MHFTIVYREPCKAYFSLFALIFIDHCNLQDVHQLSRMTDSTFSIDCREDESSAIDSSFTCDALYTHISLNTQKCPVSLGLISVSLVL